MGKVGLDVVEPLRVNLVADGDGEAERESFFGLHVERFSLRRPFGERIFRVSGGEQLVAGVEQFDSLDHRYDEVDTRIQRSSERAFRLADADAGHPARDDDDRGRDQQRRPGQHDQSDGGPPTPRRGWRGSASFW